MCVSNNCAAPYEISIKERDVPSALDAWVRNLFERLGIRIVSGEVLAKILTRNDDSGRHGVLIPSEAYSFFPDLPIARPDANTTVTFRCMDARLGVEQTFAWKYYQRYPERRVTRVSSGINVLGGLARLVVFVRGRRPDGRDVYAFDFSIEGEDEAFAQAASLFFAAGVPRTPGAFIRLPIDAPEFTIDGDLSELLGRFDDVNARGWIRTLRRGDTGLGYTFESLIGIRENNDKRADFRGIEVKCKLAKESGTPSAKTNLFQQGPIWTDRRTAIDRLRAIGRLRPDGTYACHSQVTVNRNNLGLLLKSVADEEKIDLLSQSETIGYWPYALLSRRLREKHSRAVFIKVKARGGEHEREYLYLELVYCERPSIERFVELIGSKNIVFEFLMKEDRQGAVRNRGYPWRLARQAFLDHLFQVQVKLRG